MTNIVAISLVLTTLVTAGVFDLKKEEGHRVVAVGYEAHGNTIISPQQEAVGNGETDLFKLWFEKGGCHRPSARELVCDAYGKCKHRIASALGGSKEENAKEVVGHGFKKVKEKASELVKEKMEQVKEGAKEKAQDVADVTETLKGDVKRNATEDVDIIEKEGKEGIRNLLSAENFRSSMGMLHLLGFASSYGVCIWVTFISSNILSRTLRKQQFSMVQSKIYPVYFKTMAYGIATTFLGHFLSRRNHRYYANWAEAIQGFTLLASFSMTMVSSFYLEPRATKAMRERIKLEKEEGKGRDVFNVEPSTSTVDTFKDPTGVKIGKEVTSGVETEESRHELSEEIKRVKPEVERLSKNLRNLNFISSFINAMTIMALTYHLLYLSRLVHSCRY